MITHHNKGELCPPVGQSLFASTHNLPTYWETEGWHDSETGQLVDAPEDAAEQLGTRYEQFKAAAQLDIKAYQQKLKGDGSWEYIAQIKELERLQNKMNTGVLVYLFGEHLGNHLIAKFVDQCNRNLLLWLGLLTSEFRFYVLYELKNNPDLFHHC